jgi:hypothetical protein
MSFDVESFLRAKFPSRMTGEGGSFSSDTANSAASSQDLVQRLRSKFSPPRRTTLMCGIAPRIEPSVKVSDILAQALNLIEGTPRPLKRRQIVDALDVADIRREGPHTVSPSSSVGCGLKHLSSSPRKSVRKPDQRLSNARGAKGASGHLI